MVFDARDGDGVPIYHTNVLMCVATDFAMIGLDMLTDPARRREIVARLERSGRRIVALSNAQIASFAGNALELQGRDGRILALSTTAPRGIGRGPDRGDSGERDACRARYPDHREGGRLRPLHARRHSFDAARLSGACVDRPSPASLPRCPYGLAPDSVRLPCNTDRRASER